MGLYETVHPIVLLWSLLWGVYIYGAYELFRCIRNISGNRRSVSVICDISFMIIASFIIFLFALAYNFGEIRLYMPAGMLASFLLLRFTVGKVLTNLIIRFLRALVALIGKIFFFFKKVTIKLLKSLRFLVYNLINRFKRKFICKKVSFMDENKIIKDTEKTVNSGEETVVKEVTGKKRKKQHMFLLYAAIAVFAVYIVYALISQYYDINEKQAELAALNDKITVQEIKNEEITNIYNLSDKDNEDYIEQKAREDGYLYAGERVFVNISGD